MIRCLIIDPDLKSRKALALQLSRGEDVSIMGFYDTPFELPFEPEISNTDVIFIEAAHKGENWLHFVRSLKRPPLVVIHTMYRDYAVECYELDIVDYLIKPTELSRLEKTLEKIRRTLSSRLSGGETQDFIFIKSDKQKTKILLKDILYVESLKDYICIRTTNEEFVIHHTLSGFTAELPDSKFARIHRSYTVALDKVQSFGGASLRVGNKILPVGRNYVPLVRQRLLENK